MRLPQWKTICKVTHYAAAVNVAFAQAASRKIGPSRLGRFSSSFFYVVLLRLKTFVKLEFSVP